MTDEVEELGPVGYLVCEFPGNKMTGEAFPILLDLVDRGLVRVLDLVFIRKDADGTVSVLEMEDLDRDDTVEIDVAIFEGASTGLLGDDDFREVSSILEPNSSAGILLYEQRWAAPFAAALRRSGAQVIASGNIPYDALADALGVD
jgi:hypothetical protein